MPFVLLSDKLGVELKRRKELTAAAAAAAAAATSGAERCTRWPAEAADV